MGIETRRAPDGLPRKETKIEIESKLTLCPTIKSPEEISRELYGLFSPTETGEILPLLYPEFTLRQYWWTGNPKDKQIPVEILDRDNPKKVKVRGKTSKQSGSDVLDRHEHKEVHPLRDQIHSHNLDQVTHIFNCVAAASELLRSGYYNLGPIMLKERRGFAIVLNGIPLHITFDRTLEAEKKHDWFLDQIEVEYDGEKEEIDLKKKKQIHEQILETTAYIKTKFEQIAYSFQAESPSKPEWMIQHYGNVHGHPKV